MTREDLTEHDQTVINLYRRTIGSGAIPLLDPIHGHIVDKILFSAEVVCARILTRFKWMC